MSSSINSESRNPSDNASITSEQDKYLQDHQSLREPSSDLGSKYY